MASIVSSEPQLPCTTSPPALPSTTPSVPSSPSPVDLDLHGSDADDGDVEPAVSLDSIDISIPGSDADESWHSWRTRYSDETDISNKSVASKNSEASRQSVESQASSSSAQTFVTDSAGSQDIEVITSPNASMTLHPYDQKVHPYNLVDGAHKRADSASSNSALPPNRFAYPDSYSEGNPYAYPTSSITADSTTAERQAACLPIQTSSTSPSDAPSSVAGPQDDFSSNSAMSNGSSVQTSAPNPALQASAPTRRRLNASIPIINPLDRSVVRPPTMQAKEAERGLLTVEEEPSEVGERTVVPSPIPTPTVTSKELHEPVKAATGNSEHDSKPTEVAQVVYCAKPPIDFKELMAAAQTKRASEAVEKEGSVASATSTTTAQSAFKSPNVYINGLPPYYPEDELLALTSPYGTVRSVRSFTRHVDISPSASTGAYADLTGDGISLPGKKASGYGFVLFETIEGAERCIEGLKKYRNLHPSFSKQVHKIPGTPYTAVQSPAEAEVADDKEDESDSFKAKMEKFEDKSSTNLYIEGLPLSIDGPLLAALVSPYQIKSSRFFQTKLSHPPRIIAFVRLETRSAAEEIIERLHGRMVRGWNDTGSRISVRFADSTEQRELRRNERQGHSTQRGELSSNKLTMAQAALLSLRGRDLKNESPGVSPSTTLSSLASSPSLATLSTMPSAPSYGRAQKMGDYASHAMGRGTEFALGPAGALPSITSPSFGADAINASPYIPARFLHGTYEAEDVDRQHAPFQNVRPHFNMLDQMAAQRTHGTLARDALTGRYPVIGSGQHIETMGATPLADGLGTNAGHAVIGMGLRGVGGMGFGMSNGRSHHQSVNGYTPAEELLFQAHNASLRHRNNQPQVKPSNIPRPHQGSGRTQGRGSSEASVGKWRSNSVALKSLNTGGRDLADEENFHSNYRQGGRPLNDDIMPAPKGSRDTSASYRQHQQQSAAPSHGHVRSTTVPHANRTTVPTRHQQHSSISNPHSSISANNRNVASTDSRNASSFNKFSKLEHHNLETNNTNQTMNNSGLPLKKLYVNVAKTQPQTHHQHQRSSSDLYKNDNNGQRNNGTFARTNRPTRSDNAHESPVMPSPTLTCGSQTPSTLSPATPYFGSFASSDGVQTQAKVSINGGTIELKGAISEQV